jgi:hypothetical protein
VVGESTGSFSGVEPANDVLALAVGRLPAAAQHYDLVGEPEHARAMRQHHNRRFHRPEPPGGGGQRLIAVGVEGGVRLVEDDQVRPG